MIFIDSMVVGELVDRLNRILKSAGKSSNVLTMPRIIELILPGKNNFIDILIPFFFDSVDNLLDPH